MATWLQPELVSRFSPWKTPTLHTLIWTPSCLLRRSKLFHHSPVEWWGVIQKVMPWLGLALTSSVPNWWAFCICLPSFFLVESKTAMWSDVSRRCITDEWYWSLQICLAYLDQWPGPKETHNSNEDLIDITNYAFHCLIQTSPGARSRFMKCDTDLGSWGWGRSWWPKHLHHLCDGSEWGQSTLSSELILDIICTYLLICSCKKVDSLQALLLFMARHEINEMYVP